jgi:hypothetical protein
VVKDQLDRDKDLIDLFMAMKEACLFVDEVQLVREKTNSLEKVIKDILKQTIESTIFIREYTGHGFGGMLY